MGIYKPYIEYSQPLLSSDEYLFIHEQSKEEIFEDIDKLEGELGFHIDKEYFEKLALHLQVVKKKSKINYQHGRILYSVLRNYLSRNNEALINIFETGTARGFSSICLSKALNDSDRNGVIITLDVLPHNKELYWNCIDDNEGKNTRAKLLSRWPNETKNIIFLEGETKNVLEGIYFERIHMSFLDAQHEKKDVLNEYNFVKSKQQSGDIIILDDYTPGLFDGVVEAVNIINAEKLYNIKIFSNSSERGYVIAIRK